jgi:hypothetical protein
MNAVTFDVSKVPRGSNSHVKDPLLGSVVVATELVSVTVVADVTPAIKYVTLLFAPVRIPELEIRRAWPISL